MKYILFPIAVIGSVFAALPALAQVIPAGDEAGNIPKRFQPKKLPQAVATERTGLESTMAPAKAAKYKLLLNGIRLQGNTAFSAADLADLYADLIGKQITVKDVFEVAAKITARYGRAGYALSRVIVPPQPLKPAGATITLRVLEGYIDDVIWPEGLDRYRNLFDEYGEKIKSMRPYRAQAGERYLLLASDLPGLVFRSNWKASKTNPLASTMIITLVEDPYDLQISADNHGTEGSGPYQATISGSLNNPLGFHERWTAGYTIAGPSSGSARPELHYLFFGYDQVLNSEGLKFSFSGNASWGEPGTTALSAINYESRGLNLSAALSFPFIRTRPENLTGTLAFDFKNSEGFQFGAMSSEDRLRIIRAELAYDKADKWNGTNQIVLSASLGIDGLGSTGNTNPIASRTPGRVDFFKTTVSLSRMQPLKNGFSAYGSVFGQWTADPLLSSQECGYGGQQYGRGFVPSIITGDRCLLLSGELRYNLSPGKIEFIDYAQVYGFADYGRIWNINAPLGTPKTDRAASAGMGIRFGSDAFSADLTVSRTIDEPTSTPDPSDWRFWFRLTKPF